MFPESTVDPIKQAAVTALTASFVAQGHPAEYATQMATAAIFQADLELRNAQMTRLLGWLKQEQPEVYPMALSILEQTREDFEKRVATG